MAMERLEYTPAPQPGSETTSCAPPKFCHFLLRHAGCHGPLMRPRVERTVLENAELTPQAASLCNRPPGDMMRSTWKCTVSTAMLEPIPMAT